MKYNFIKLCKKRNIMQLLKHLMFSICLGIVFISCSKDSNNANNATSISEQTILNVAYGTDALQKNGCLFACK